MRDVRRSVRRQAHDGCRQPSPPARRRASPLEEARKPKGALGALAHHRALAKAWLEFNAQVLRATTLSERQREQVILRVTAVRKAAYNWAEHVPIARRCGLDDEEIARVAYGPDAPFWDPVDAALLRSVDELVADGMVSDETWAVLAEHLDARQLLDRIFTVGAYETIGWMSRSCALVASLDRAATIADRVAIEDLINRYVDAIDAKRWDLLEHVFAEDAVARWNPEASIDGRDAVIDAMRHRLDTDEVVTYHHAASFTPVIHGDTAEANVRIRAMHYGVGPRAGGSTRAWAPR